jgi:hypothetical protein
MNQTAVEWLVEQTESLITIETFQKWKELKEQALEMEKEQIINAYSMGLSDEGIKSIHTRANAEEYYKETYGE